MAFRRRCAWCAVNMTGLRRLWAGHCRRCSSRMANAGICQSGGGPDVSYGARAGFREVLPRYPKGA